MNFNNPAPEQKKLATMLKRKMGRYLLTLLVVTGLAGTINHYVVSRDERKYAIGLMKETQKDVLKLVKGLTPEQFNYKPAADKWSIKECVYHIASAEKGLWTYFENSVKAAANPEKRAEIKVTDDAFVAMIKDRSKKADAPETMRPEKTGYKTIKEALADFKKNRLEHIKYMKNTTEDLRNHIVQAPMGWIDCYQLYLMIAAHSNRHAQQIEEIIKSPGFPAK